jgi:methylenetetrahydrofolate--tRNA-(uracil-5-)-methyltransferase
MTPKDLNMARYLEGKEILDLDATTGSGALACYISSYHTEFNPMNVNFGIFSPLDSSVKKKDRKTAYVNRALKKIEEYLLDE